MTSLFLTALLATSPGASDPSAGGSEPQLLSGKGVHFLETSIRSPVAGVGSRGDFDTMRVILDDGYTHLRYEPAAGRLFIRNDHVYSNEQIVLDITYLGIGKTTSGEQVSFAVHFKIKKHGSDHETTLHVHQTTRDKMATVQLPKLTIEFSDGKAPKVVHTPAQAEDAVRDPSVTTRLAKLFAEVQNNLEGVQQDPSSKDYRAADLSVGIGLGKLSKLVIRAQLFSLSPSNAPLLEKKVVAEILQAGDWELRLTAISSLLPKDILQRHLTVLGLADIPLVAPVMADGLKKRETLSFVMRNGKGALRFRGKEHALANSLDVARHYLEFNFLGALLERAIRL